MDGSSPENHPPRHGAGPTGSEKVASDMVSWPCLGSLVAASQVSRAVCEMQNILEFLVLRASSPPGFLTQTVLPRAGAESADRAAWQANSNSGYTRHPSWCGISQGLLGL